MKKVAVVTGANRGLGLGTAQELGRLGYTVVMVGRDAEKIEQAAKNLKMKGYDTRPLQADVALDSDVERVAAFVKKEFGRLDALVNNAGVFLDRAPDSADFDAESGSAFAAKASTMLKAFEINTLGPMKLIQACAPFLRESAAGRVVNVSSGMGALGEMDGAFASYRVSKTALNALTRIFASEFSGTPVKVNSVSPGWVRTDMGGPGANRTIEEGVRGIVWAAILPADGPTGGFYRDGKAIDW